MTDQPDGASVVLIHGLWLTPLGWERWVAHYTERGERVLAPAWPGMDIGEDALRADASGLNGLGVIEVADHYDTIIRGLAEPPILIGHSFGGLLVQILLDRGLGSAGVALHPAPPKGVLRLPLSSLKSAFPVLRNPANRTRTVALTPQQWHYGFTNTFDDDESQELYERYHVPSSGRPLWQAATANTNPHAATKVGYQNNDRAPLLLVAGTDDHTVAASLVRENHKRYRKATALSEYKEYPGRCHFTMAQPGWEQVADDALDWANKNRRTS